jgi:peptide deformylase
MKTLPIVIYPAKSLKLPSKEVALEKINTPEYQELFDVMINTMQQAQGVGLAAPQIGKNERIIIVELKSKPQVFINPKITQRSDATAINEEGCLSLPGVWGLVERAKMVSVEAFNRQGKKVSLKAKGFEAIKFQHEIDHLDGILFIDKAAEVMGVSRPAK